MVSKTELKRITSETNRNLRYNNYVSKIEELTKNATGKKGLISFYKNRTSYFNTGWSGSRINWPHYYCDNEAVKLFRYLTKGKLRILEKYMPNYYEFINKYYSICCELLRETDNMFGNGGTRKIKEGQHFYNGSLDSVIKMLNEKLIILKQEKTKYLLKIHLLKKIFITDVVSNIQTFL